MSNNNNKKLCEILKLLSKILRNPLRQQPKQTLGRAATSYTGHTSYLYELVKSDHAIFVEIDLFDHVSDLVSWYIFTKCLHQVANLTSSNAAIPISIKLEQGRRGRSTRRRKKKGKGGREGGE